MGTEYKMPADFLAKAEWNPLLEDIQKAMCCWKSLGLDSLVGINGSPYERVKIILKDLNGKELEINPADVESHLFQLEVNGANPGDVVFGGFLKAKYHIEMRGSGDYETSYDVCDGRATITNEQLITSGCEIPLSELHTLNDVKKTLAIIWGKRYEEQKLKNSETQEQNTLIEKIDGETSKLFIQLYIHEILRPNWYTDQESLIENLSAPVVVGYLYNGKQNSCISFPNVIIKSLGSEPSLVYYIKTEGNKKTEKFLVMATTINGKIVILNRNGSVYETQKENVQPVVEGRGFEAKKVINPVLKQKILETLKNPSFTLATKNPATYEPRSSW
jgi:hypothetical protein